MCSVECLVSRWGLGWAVRAVPYIHHEIVKVASSGSPPEDHDLPSPVGWYSVRLLLYEI
jgi:hypothetical protein